MKTFLEAACLALLIAVAVGVSHAATGTWETAESSAAARVDKLFAEWDRSDSPGCSVGVSQNGAVVYERGYGIANLERGVPLTPESVFHVASISKQFTAMSILLLAERGELSLDDEVRKHIPEWADDKNRITIRHLLTHTSGLRDAFLLRELAAPNDRKGDLNEAIVKILAQQRTLNFAPGSESNTATAVTSCSPASSSG